MTLRSYLCPEVLDEYAIECLVAQGLSPIETVFSNSSAPAQLGTAGGVASTDKDGSDMSDVSGFTPDMRHERGAA